MHHVSICACIAKYTATYKEQTGDQDERDERLLESESAGTGQGGVVLCLLAAALNSFIVGGASLIHDFCDCGHTVVVEAARNDRASSHRDRHLCDEPLVRVWN